MTSFALWAQRRPSLALIMALAVGLVATTIAVRAAAPTVATGPGPTAPAASAAPSTPTASAAARATSSAASQAPGVDSQRLDQLHQTHWSAREGLIGPVMAIAQTTDGYLWLGTAHGLFRFDGVRFEPFESIAGERLASTSVLTLHAGPDNSLWVGLMSGGLSLVRDGHIVHSDKADKGAFEASTRRFATERDGTVWVATGRALLKRSPGNDQWERIDVKDGYPDKPPRGLLSMHLLIDRDDNLWVVTNEGVFVKAAGQRRFEESRIKELNFSQLADDRDGRVWATRHLTPEVTAFGRLPRPNHPEDREDEWHVVPGGMFMPMFDRDGYVWYGAGDGLNRERIVFEPVPADGSPRAATPMASASAPMTAASDPALDGVWPVTGAAKQRLMTDSGLSGDQVLTTFQDREGSIWVGTNGGLDQLRPNRVSRFDFPRRPSNISMAVGTHGDLWFTVRNQGLFRLPSADADTLQDLKRGQDQSLTMVRVDRAGQVWLGGRKGLWRWHEDGTTERDKPSQLADWTGAVIDFVEGKDNERWVTAQTYSVSRIKDGVWTRASGKNDVPLLPANCLAEDSEGRVWLGLSGAQLVRIDGQTIKQYRQADGVAVGDVLELLPVGDKLWIGGEHGVQVLDASGFRQIRAESPTALDGVSGLVFTPAGDLWTNGSAGITRIEAAELNKALADPKYRVAITQLDTLDGLPGRAETSWPLRTALRSPEGTLWFSLSNGVVTVDPDRLMRNGVPASVHVQRVVAGETRWPVTPQSAIHTAPATTELRIDYAATALAMPERVRFRYRLVGLDERWQDADTRRQAFYTNLGPGHYEFQVTASNEDGLWNPQPATVAIDIPPTFVQSIWFRGLCVLAALLLIGLVIWWRGRLLEARANERLMAKLEERGRIAQDLHDTLLQGFQGLVLKFERSARAIPADSPARLELDRTLDQADAVLVEGRDRVADLRQSPLPAGDLDRMMEALGQDLSALHGTAFQLKTEGTVRRLNPLLQAELALVAREAVFNAFRHAQASLIDVGILYDASELRLRISDNGCGIPDEVLSRGDRPGHWGLSGMRERVVRASGRFDVRCSPGGGTVIEVTFPAAVAYDESTAPGWWARWWRVRWTR